MNMVFTCTTVKAFFNRGRVDVQCSRQSVSMEVGQSPMTIGIVVSPTSDSQTCGCGMSECPDSCHEGCLDENGNCTCSGTEYKTYTTDVSVSSSNPSVALGTYNGGTLTIEPLGPGTAILTVTGTLREWSSGSAGVQVTVTGEIPPTEEPEPEESAARKEPEEPEPEETVPADQPPLDPWNSSGAGGSGGTGDGSGESSSETANTVSKEAEELEEELAAQMPEEQTLITQVPEPAPQKSWKIYSLGNVDADKEEEGGREGPEDALRPVAAGLGFLLLSTGFISKLILFKGQL